MGSQRLRDVRAIAAFDAEINLHVHDGASLYSPTTAIHRGNRHYTYIALKNLRLHSRAVTVEYNRCIRVQALRPYSNRVRTRTSRESAICSTINEARACRSNKKSFSCCTHLQLQHGIVASSAASHVHIIQLESNAGSARCAGGPS